MSVIRDPELTGFKIRKLDSYQLEKSNASLFQSRCFFLRVFIQQGIASSLAANVIQSMSACIIYCYADCRGWRVKVEGRPVVIANRTFKEEARLKMMGIQIVCAANGIR